MQSHALQIRSAPTEGTVKPASAAFGHGAAVLPTGAPPGATKLARTSGRDRRTPPNLRRVLAMTLTATLHIIVFAALLLPDARPVVDRLIPAASSSADLSDRLTMFVGLEAPFVASPPSPPQPQAVPAAPIEVEPEPMPVVSEPEPTRSEAISPPTADRVPPTEISPAPAPSSRTAGAEGVTAPVTNADSSTAIAASAAPAVSPDTARRERDAYIQALMAALLQQRVYPAAARKAREQGVVHVRFTIDRNGKVLSSKVQRAAGALLDAAALEVLQRAAPLPPIPASMARQTLTITVPIEYRLTTR